MICIYNDGGGARVKCRDGRARPCIVQFCDACEHVEEVKR